MQIIPRSQSKRKKNSEVCEVFEYPIKSKDLGGAVINVTGRFPDKGRLLILKGVEMAYIIKGSGVVETDDQKSELKEGDVVLIEANEPYFWNGNFTGFFVNYPPFDPEHFKMVD